MTPPLAAREFEGVWKLGVILSEAKDLSSWPKIAE